MAKFILDQSTFLKGLNDNDKGGNYALRDIDLFRDYGYLVPGFLKTDITITGQNSDIIEIINDPIGNRAYLIGAGARIYGIDTFTDADLGDNFGGGSQNYVTVAGLSEAKGIITYVTQDTAYRAIFAYNGTSNDIAKGVLTNNWATTNLDQDWGSTLSGGATLQVGRRDIIEWRSYVWVTNGRYVGRIDALAATATFNPTFYDLGLNWTADRLFITDNYLGIVASKARNATTPGSQYAPTSGRNPNECRIDLINLAGTLIKITPLDGINQVHSIVNRNGTILPFSDDRSAGHIVSVLGDEGVEEVKRLQHDVSGTLNTFLSPRSQSAVSIYKNKVLFGTEGSGTTSGRAFIFGFGRKNIDSNYILYQPYSLSGEAASRVTSLKQTYTDKFYTGYYDGTNYKFAKLSTGYSTSANYKAGYIDFGQRIKLNYVKFYFKPLVTSDSITCGLDVDYGTAVTLGIGTGNVSYTKDGAVTSKKFNIGKQCHSFRPTISWGAGGVAISKIVFDYSFISD
jgi:hypothetical protein